MSHDQLPGLSGHGSLAAISTGAPHRVVQAWLDRRPFDLVMCPELLAEVTEVMTDGQSCAGGSAWTTRTHSSIGSRQRRSWSTTPPALSRPPVIETTIPDSAGSRSGGRLSGAVLRSWLDESVAVAFAERVLVVDEAVARRAAALRVPDPAPFRDALIGTTALAHRMTVVTRNVSDFERFDSLEVLNPWS